MLDDDDSKCNECYQPDCMCERCKDCSSLFIDKQEYIRRSLKQLDEFGSLDGFSV
jgi:hypothetical protein